MSPFARRRLWCSAVTAGLLLVPAGCREAERGVSGDSWDCLCLVDPDGREVEASVCALTAGEASQLATGCVAEAWGTTIRFCDCIESTRPFCELGDCVLR